MMDRLTTYLREHTEGGVALAYSGGVDSTLLLHALLRLREEQSFPLVAYYFRTPLQTEEETQDALQTARHAGIEPVQMEHDPLQLPRLRFNPKDRCYHCKLHMFSHMAQDAVSGGLHVLMDGTNADDHRQYRPGLQALRELGVLSPLAAVGFTKAQVRELATAWGIPCASKPSAPCLATRFDYGVELSPEAIRRVEAGESLLRRHFPGEPLRLRVHGNLARLELPPALMPAALQLAPTLTRDLQALGYRHITLDLLGFRSGSYDEPTTSS